MSYPVFYVPAGDVLPILFASYDKDDGSSITLTGLAATDIEIYKDGGVTQRASDAGYTLLDTDGIDFDGITGIHGFSIDTGDNTDASFYTVGAWYHVVVSAVTIDAVAVSFIAAAFRIMKAEGVAGVPKADVDAWLGTAAATPTTAGVPEVDVTHWLGTAAATPTVAGVPEVDVTHIGGTGVTAAAGIPEVKVASLATGSITAGVIAADAIGASELAADAVAEIADAVWDEDATAHQTTGTFGQAIGDPVADTNTIYGAVVTGATGATIAADIITIDDLLDSEVPALTTELAKVPKSDGTASWNATALAAIQSEANDALVAYDPPTKAELDSAVAPLALEATLATVDNLIDTEISTLITMLTGIVPVNGTIGATGNSTTALHLDGIAWADDGPNSMLLTIQDVSTGLYYSRWIEDFATTGDLATVATLPFTPEASVDKYWLTPVRADVTGGSGLDAAGVRAAIGLASANLDTQLTAIDDAIDSEVAAILADTNELQTDLTNGGRLDLLIDAIKAKTDNLPAAPAATGDIPTAAAIADAVWDEDATAHQTQGTFGQAIGDPGADTDTIYALLNTIAGYLDTEVAAILADTAELQGDWANGGRLDLLIDAIKAKTDSLTFTTANQVDAQVISLATGAITAGSIAADAIGASELAADAATEIATAVWASATRTLSALGFTLGASDLAADTIGASELASDAITEIVNAVLTTAMTESYNVDGAAPTLAQALFVTMQRLTEFAISGTTITVKKLDGSTSAYTLTLDDATSPTSSTRAS
jgi:hypothetical protein